MKALLQVCVLSLALAAQGQGYVECISGFPWNAGGGGGPGTIGFTFKANQAMTVLQLGVFSEVANTGNFDVGLWGPSGLLGSITITPLSPENNFTRYETLPVAASLEANAVYFIGAYLPVSISVHYAGSFFGNTYETLSIISEVGYAATNSTSLTQPVLVTQGEGNLPGVVNFRIIPEPVAGIAGLAFAALIATRFRRK